MKKILFLLLLSISVHSQSFTAETGMIFIDDAAKGQYSGGIKVLSGILKNGEEIDVYAPTGRKFTFKITMIKVNDQAASQAKVGQDVFVGLYTKDRADQGKDAINEGFKCYPKGFSPTGNAVTTAVKPTPATAAKSDFTATLNGKPYTANVSIKGALYYPNGNKLIEKPFLQLSFTPSTGKDNRTLLIQIFNPKRGKATYSSKMEINFSGDELGRASEARMFGKGAKVNADVPFTVEITEWAESGETATISGKINGTLMETFTVGKKQSLELKAGVFTNIKIEILK